VVDVLIDKEVTYLVMFHHYIWGWKY